MPAYATQRTSVAQTPEQSSDQTNTTPGGDSALAMQGTVGNAEVQAMLAAQSNTAATSEGKKGSKVAKVGSAAGRMLSHAWSTAGKGLGLFGKAMLDPASAGWKAAKESTGNVWDTMKSGAGKTWDALKGGVGNTYDAAKNGIGDTLSAAGDGISGSWSSLWSGDFGGAWDKLKGGASGALDAAKGGLGNTWDALKDGAGSVWDQGKEAVGDTVGAISSGVDHVKDAVVEKMLEFEENELYYKNGKKLTGPDPSRLYEAAPLSTTDNSYSKGMDVPATTDKFNQNYSPLGIPLTKEAWEMQNRIDGGALQKLHDTTLMGNLQEAGVLDTLVKDGTLSADSIPEDFSKMDPEALRDLVLTVDDASATRSFFQSMSPQDYTTLQTTILDGYMDLANQDPDQAVMLLDALPTEMDMGIKISEMMSGDGPNNFQAGDDTSAFREGAATVAESMRKDGKQVYGLVVPYANSVENIVANDGEPKDLVQNFSNYLGKLDPDTTSMISGYSQSGAGVLDYANQYGGTQGLDYAAAIAPMGGADRKGGTGTYNGTIRAKDKDDAQGVQTMSFMNENDPAQYIHTNEGKRHFYWSLANFAMPNDGFMGRFKKGDGDLHGGFDDVADGTYGYPMDKALPLMEQMVSSDTYGEQDYGRVGGWDYDTRKS